ncbi:MAG: DUF6371 domain-containing protein [Bacteroidales bacterium]|nr:DUF6371 domain-containing protein [Bacteroidales bacterium]
MAEYRFILDKSSKKHVCPDCGKRTFVRYIDLSTGDYAPEQYGRCDRESKCSYHNKPPLETLCYFVPIDGIKEISLSAYAINQKGKSIAIPKQAVFEQNANGIYLAEYFISDKKNRRNDNETIEYSLSEKKYFAENGSTAVVSTVKPKAETKAPVFIPVEVLNETLKPERYSQNIFIQNLLNRVAYPFHAKDVEAVTSLYYLGTIANGYRAGAITFPFIDFTNNIRAVQVKQFGETNHTTGTGFLHSLIESHYTKNKQPLPDWLKAYNENDLKVSCLFGEHLLKRYPNNPIGLVEAPKTAIYCSLYFGLPETPSSLIWLAVYNKSSFTFDKLKALQGRNVFVFPDLSKDGKTFAEWQGKAKEYEQRLKGTRFVFSDLLEQLAPESDKYNGNDIADYLIKLDWRQFRTEQPAPDPAKTEVCKKSEAPKKHLFFRNKETTPRPKPKAQPKISLSELQRQWYCLMLEAQFKGEPQPENTLKLGRCKSVEDVKNLFTTHYQAISSKATSEMLPYLERLQTMKEVLTT